MATAKNLTDSIRTKTLKYTNASAVSAGDIVTINGKVCIALDDYDANAEGIYIWGSDMIEGPKEANLAVTAGETAYWDATNSVFTSSDGAGANTKVGVFVESAAATDTTCVLALINY